MSTIPLYQSASVTFAADGSGLARLSPQVFGVKWHVKRIVVSTTTPNANTQFFLYLNQVSDSSRLDATYRGDQDTSETDINLQTLDTLYCVWRGGQSGAVGTVVITGDIETGR